jgi:hypothetical protein
VSFTIVTYDCQNIFVIQATVGESPFYAEQEESSVGKLSVGLLYFTTFNGLEKKTFKIIVWVAQRFGH